MAVFMITAREALVVRHTALGTAAVDLNAQPFGRDRLLGAVAKALARNV
jgi:hypothetical protein